MQSLVWGVFVTELHRLYYSNMVKFIVITDVEGYNRLITLIIIFLYGAVAPRRT